MLIIWQDILRTKCNGKSMKTRSPGVSALCQFAQKSAYTSQLVTHFSVQTAAWLNFILIFKNRLLFYEELGKMKYRLIIF